MRGLDSVAHMPAGKEKRPPKVLDHMNITEGEKGGHTVEHHFTHYEHAPEAHVFGKTEGNEMLMHVAKHANVEHTLIPTPNENAEVAKDENTENKGAEQVEA